MSETIYSFEPIIDENSRILILGTLPSRMSLMKKQYYGNAANQFWKIVYTVFDVETVDDTYEDRIRFVLRHRLAIWDVYHSAEREGSLDKNIKNGTPNDISSLLRRYPQIKRIVVGGTRAKTEYNRFFRDIPVEAVFVPSTSPIQGKNVKPLEEKIQLWKSALTL